VRHHFGDSLLRDGGYWTIVPNRDRYCYRIGDVPAGSPEISIVTIGKDDERWAHVASLPNLEELTLHEPTKEQLAGLSTLSTVKRLRITHARPKSIEFIGAMTGVEELVLEYVSGFSDLSPLRQLTRLRSLHMENLRRVVDFGGLFGISSLRYLSIHGTLDWKQPIGDFEFLRGLGGLELLGMFQVITKAAYPALLPVLSLGNLQRLMLAGSYFDTAEYALLEEGLPRVQGASWGPYDSYAYRYMELSRNDLRSRLPDEVIRTNHPDVVIRPDGRREIADPASCWFEFTGKGAGRVKCDGDSAEEKCREQAARYDAMKKAARTFISLASERRRNNHSCE
jgi:hypothetical protein